MSLDNWEKYDYNLQKRKTCPECGGSGKDNATLDWKCWKCNGIGIIKIKEKNKRKK